VTSSDTTTRPLLSWSEYRHVSASFGVLSLDRRLNFLSYSQPLRPNAGISAGIINAGVSDIDGRDSDGEPTGPLKTSENEIFLSFSNRFKSGFSLGITIKLLYHQLYTDVTSSTVGIDVGLLVPIGDVLTIGATATRHQLQVSMGYFNALWAARKFKDVELPTIVYNRWSVTSYQTVSALLQSILKHQTRKQ